MKKNTILVMDDEREMADLIADLLVIKMVDCEIAVQTCSSVAQAERMLSKKEFDGAILDNDVVGETDGGLRLSKIIKERYPERNTLRLIMTGRPKTQEEEAELKANSDMYFRKRERISNIVDAFIKELGRRKK